MKDAYSYYIEPFENFDQVIAWESPGEKSERLSELFFGEIVFTEHVEMCPCNRRVCCCDCAVQVFPSAASMSAA